MQKHNSHVASTTLSSGFRWTASEIVYHTDFTAQSKNVANLTPRNERLVRIAEDNAPPADWFSADDNPFESEH